MPFFEKHALLAFMRTIAKKTLITTKKPKEYPLNSSEKLNGSWRKGFLPSVEMTASFANHVAMYQR